jgi:uncharacterized membrane protein
MSKAKDSDNNKKNKDTGLGSVNLLIKVIMLLIAVASISVSSYSLLFFLFGMLPGIVSATIDKRSSKAASNTIGAFNLVGIIPYMSDMWHSGAGEEVVKQLLFDPMVWFNIYGMAGIGWLMIVTLPTIIGHIFVARAEFKGKKYKVTQQELIDEWGIAISRD